MKARLVILACVIALVASAASARELTYSYVQGGWASSDPDGGDSGAGPMLDVSYGVTDFVHVLGSYEDYDYDYADATFMQVGAGLHWSVGQSFDLIGQASFVDAEVDTAFGGASDNGFSLSGGARKMLTESWELHGEIERIDVGDYDDTLLGVNALYALRERYAIEAGYKVGDNNVLHVGFRMNFGRR